MNSNFLKTTLRNLYKEKVNTLIGIVGLCMGLVASICILLYNQFELSFDSFHKENRNIYRLIDDFKNSSSQSTNAYTFYAVAKAIKEEIPEIELSVSALPAAGVFRKEDRVFNESAVLITQDCNILNAPTSPIDVAANSTKPPIPPSPPAPPDPLPGIPPDPPPQGDSTDLRESARLRSRRAGRGGLRR